jgi:hypothetical protein
MVIKDEQRAVIKLSLVERCLTEEAHIRLQNVYDEVARSHAIVFDGSTRFQSLMMDFKMRRH